MLKNPFVRFYNLANDLDDFKMPYTLYGKVDLENIADKYQRLTNKPASYLEVRFNNG